MKFIDMFSGIGGFRTAMENNGHECIAYSEIDKYAKQSYQAMYDTENEIDLGDITEISQEYLSRFKEENDIVVGGSPCFRKGTLITTKNGLKPIEEIKKGDYVLTHNNRYKEVVVPMVNPAKEIYSLKVEEVIETFVTPEHPIRVKESRESEPKWIKVKDLDKEKHFVQLGNFEYSTIEEVKLLSTDETVYNFEVEDDNSYVANNMVVHNCQSFSLAGSRKGFEDTRGTLFFEYAKVVKETQPKYFLFENVKGLMSHDKGNTIRVVLETFNELGYCIDFNVFNSKYYGVPQNRERIYILGKRKDLVEQPKYHDKTKGKKKFDEIHNWAVDNINYIELLPPLQTEVTTRLIDVLEDEVDEKYYLSDEKTKKLTLNTDLSGKLNMYNYNERDKVHSVNKVSPTLNTMQGGNRQPKIAVKGFKELVRVRKFDVNKLELSELLKISKKDAHISNKEISEKLNIPITKVEHWFRTDKSFAIPDANVWFELKQILNITNVEHDEAITTFVNKESNFDTTNRIYDTNHLSPTLNTTSEPKIAVREATKQGYAIAEQGDSVNVTYPDSKTRRGRVGKQVAQTLQAGEVNQGVVMNDIRIRKLVPIETWRLQGFTDEQFYKAKESGVSNSQLYKQSGNAITISVADAIIKKITEG